jgi:hypothetical protein
MTTRIAGMTEDRVLSRASVGIDTGLDYFGLRYMSAAQGRFTTPDPNSAGPSLFEPQ